MKERPDSNHDKVLSNIQDGMLKFTVLFGMIQLSRPQEGGVGGHDPNGGLEGLKILAMIYSRNPKLIDKLERQIYLQSKSLDTLEQATKV